MLNSSTEASEKRKEKKNSGIYSKIAQEKTTRIKITKQPQLSFSLLRRKCYIEVVQNSIVLYFTIQKNIPKMVIKNYGCRLRMLVIRTSLSKRLLKRLE